MNTTEHRYAAYYCEENAWHLCQATDVAGLEPLVVFVSNAARSCPMWQQRAAPPGEAVAWDYHVVVATTAGEPLVWDLDSRLGMPVPAALWLGETFIGVPDLRPRHHPRFRVVPAAELVATFSSDRSHMRLPGGAWAQPPPPWAPLYAPERGMNLDAFIDMRRPFVGEVLDLAGLARRLGLEG